MLDITAAYTTHVRELYGYVRHLAPEVADDLSGALWLKVCARASSYQECGQLRGWLFRIAHHLILDYRRADRRHPLSPLCYDNRTVDAPGCAHLDAVGDARALLARLTPAQQRAAWLYWACDWSLLEVAEDMGLTRGAVKSLLHRTRVRCCGY